MTEKKLTTNACAPVVDNQNVIAGPRGPASSDGAAQKSTSAGSPPGFGEVTDLTLRQESEL